MFQHSAFQQLVSDVYELLPYVRLKLPASLGSVRKQVGYLNLAQLQIRGMQDKVAALAKANHNPSLKRKYEIFIDLLHTLDQEVKDLKLLAEEYPIDPEGTLSCLEGWAEKEARLANQIEGLKNMSTNTLAHKLMKALSVPQNSSNESNARMSIASQSKHIDRVRCKA